MALTVTSTRDRDSLAPTFKEAAAPRRVSRLERFSNLVAAVDNVPTEVFQAAVEIVSGFAPKSHAVEAWDFLQALAASDTKEFVEDEADQVGDNTVNVGEDDTPFNDDEPYSTNKHAASDDDDDEWEKPWEKDDEGSESDEDDDEEDEDNGKTSSLFPKSYSFAIEAGYDNGDARDFANWNTSEDFDNAINEFWEQA